MEKIISNFPKQFSAGLKAAEKIKIYPVKGKFNKILVCAMGGSALPGDVLGMWLKANNIDIPLIVNRTYELPKVNKNCLVICISYSGNTEETIFCYQEAIRKKLKIAAISSGGKITRHCQKNNIPVAIVPSGLPPRLSLGYQFFALLKILANSRLIQPKFKEILGLEKELKPKNFREQGKTLAKNLKHRIPLIYTNGSQRILARIWKINFNETAKIFAFNNCFPELNHTEISGFFKIKKQIAPDKLYVLILEDKSCNQRVLKQIKIFQDLIAKENIKIRFIPVQGKDILEKVFSSLILSYWTSYYLALEYKIDPIKIEMIENLKREL